MDGGKSLIVNLALGDADARRPIGCLLTVSAEQAALSRADRPPGDRGPSHHLVIDEFSEFMAQSEEALSRMLSLTRKYGIFLVMAHQTWGQASERLQGALQNCGLEVAFRLGRENAEVTAKNLGRVAPVTTTQRSGTDSEGLGMGEQWAAQVQELQDLRPRRAFVRKPLPAVPWPWSLWWHRPPSLLYKLKTMSVPDPAVATERLAEIEEGYLRRFFRTQAEVEETLDGFRGKEDASPYDGVSRPFDEGWVGRIKRSGVA